MSAPRINLATVCAERDRLKRVNAELVKALEQVEFLITFVAHECMNTYDAIRTIRAALAKHKVATA